MHTQTMDGGWGVQSCSRAHLTHEMIPTIRAPILVTARVPARASVTPPPRCMPPPVATGAHMPPLVGPSISNTYLAMSAARPGGTTAPSSGAMCTNETSSLARTNGRAPAAPAPADMHSPIAPRALLPMPPRGPRPAPKPTPALLLPSALVVPRASAAAAAMGEVTAASAAAAAAAAAPAAGAPLRRAWPCIPPSPPLPAPIRFCIPPSPPPPAPIRFCLPPSPPPPCGGTWAPPARCAGAPAPADMHSPIAPAAPPRAPPKLTAPRPAAESPPPPPPPPPDDPGPAAPDTPTRAAAAVHVDMHSPIAGAAPPGGAPRTVDCGGGGTRAVPRPRAEGVPAAAANRGGTPTPPPRCTGGGPDQAPPGPAPRAAAAP